MTLRCLPLAAIAALALWTAGPSAIANASPVFDVDGYDACAATTVPGPGQDFDAVVSSCCVQHAGTPAPTGYGMGCVAPMDDPTGDSRPTIILPTRMAPDGLNQQDAIDGLIDEPIPDDAVPEP